jgi:hypothetical protein
VLPIQEVPFLFKKWNFFFLPYPICFILLKIKALFSLITRQPVFLGGFWTKYGGLNRPTAQLPSLLNDVHGLFYIT